MSGAVPTTRYFQVTDGQAIYDGKHDLASAQTAAIYNGYVAALNSAGDMHLADGTENPYGLFYDHLALEEFPTSENLTTYRTAEKVNVVTGRFRALCGTGMFGGTLPSSGDLLYDAEDGQASSAGTSVIGRALDVSISVGGDVTMALCLFDFPGLTS